MLRVLPLILWVVPAVWLAILFHNAYFIVGAVFYGLISIGIGAWACRTIQHGRLRILASFCAGYLLGSMVCGVFGTVAGAVLATIVARRSLRMPDMSGGG